MTELEFKLLSMVGDDFKNSVELLNGCGYAPTVALDVLKHLITTKKYLKKIGASQDYAQFTVSLTADGRAALLAAQEEMKKQLQEAEKLAADETNLKNQKRSEFKFNFVSGALIAIIGAVLTLVVNLIIRFVG